MTKVPSSLPSQGVTINNQFVIRPLSLAQKQALVSMLTADQAITIARKYADAHLFNATTLLGSFTSIASLPPAGTTSKSHIIQNVPTWVVTFINPNPQDVIVGRKPAPGKTPGTSYPTHFTIVIHAATGAFVLGFFTA